MNTRNLAIVKTKYLRTKSGIPLKVIIGGKAIPKRKGRRPRPHALRAAELNRHFSHRYGNIIPGIIDDVEIMLHVLALNKSPRERIASWLAWRAPWFDDPDLIDEIIAHPVWLKPDCVGKKLGLTAAIRKLLDIHTVGACDRTKAERQELAKANKVARQKQRRREHGAAPQEQSIEKHAPWIARGISRRTWYRERSQTNGTEMKACNSISIYVASNQCHGHHLVSISSSL